MHLSVRGKGDKGLDKTAYCEGSYIVFFNNAHLIHQIMEDGKRRLFIRHGKQQLH